MVYLGKDMEALVRQGCLELLGGILYGKGESLFFNTN